MENPDLAHAAALEAQKRASEFFEGIYRYKSTRYERDIVEPDAVFALGSARLIDYGSPAANAPVVFLVPSLINRYYIMDLTAKLSFARFLRTQGVHVFIIDWGTPAEREQHFNCGMYVTEILVPMAEHIVNSVGKKIILGGYCMGGILSLALAQIRSDLVKGLALFATPWNFMHSNFPRNILHEEGLARAEGYINSCTQLPAAFIHTLFHRTNPYAYQNKLRKFSKLKDGDPAMQEFLAIEHWVNDGAPLAKPVAQDCFIRWVRENMLEKNQWHVGGQVINPRNLTMPGFCALPLNDKVVPPDCALPLAQHLKRATVIKPATGHIGMMVGRQRKSALWQPFRDWVYKVAADRI